MARNNYGSEGYLKNFYFKLIIPDYTNCYKQFQDLVPAVYSIPNYLFGDNEERFVNKNKNTEKLFFNNLYLMFNQYQVKFSKKN
ncbi:hypothetical protein HC864_05000 [Candidatus Gracilibacteria bacterium]|nr:hypothetical protein [Candidatus Gracilibacteria bacterium]